VHDPDGKFRKQYPKMKVRLQEEMFSSPPEAPPPSGGGLRVYTDGACWGNPGQGGWAWVVEGHPNWYGSGFFGWTTNQQMELAAALAAVRAHEGPLTIVSDSRYLTDCFRNGWWVKWLRNDWQRKQAGEWVPVKNRELWEPLVTLVRDRGDVAFEWVKGHSGNRWNELADELATACVRDQLGTGRTEVMGDLIPLVPRR